MTFLFAQQLLGRTLPGGWRVTEKMQPPPDHTGGTFSVGYRVESTSGARAFCKALDFTGALAADDPARELAVLVEAFNFERDLLDKCRTRRMDRVVSVLGDGRLLIDEENPQSVVQYLLFELADGDVRKYAKFAADLDLAWALRSLHHVSTGLMQLHRAGVAHQDLKPSNVMTFGPKIAKVGDLGRATDREREMPHDALVFAGARAYAPPELLYREVAVDWGRRRAACDLYLLGSLATFLFTGVGATVSIMTKLPASLHPVELGGTFAGPYRDALPQVRNAFARSMDEFDAAVHPAFRDELGVTVRQLCDPDPALRGEPSNRIGHRDPFNLEQFVTRFNRLAHQAEARMFETDS